MRGKYYPFAYTAYILRDGAHDGSQVCRRCISNCVGNVQCRCASFYYRIQYFAEKSEVRARSVFRRKFNVGAQRLRQLNGSPRLLQALLARHLEFVLKMDVGSREEYVNTRTRCPLQSSPGPLNILRHRARKSANDRTANL